MSLTNLNQFPVHEITLNLNSFQLVLMILGLIEFLVYLTILDTKRISHFFVGFQSLFLSSNSIKNVIIKSSTEQEQRADDDDGDVDHSTTTVCRGEVEIVLRSLGMSGEEEVKDIPATLDVFDIFEEMSPRLDEVREAFDVFDGNRDGFIDAEELQKVLCALGLKEGLEMENCRRMIGVGDEDGDGKIDFDEFVKFMENSFNY